LYSVVSKVERSVHNPKGKQRWTVGEEPKMIMYYRYVCTIVTSLYC